VRFADNVEIQSQGKLTIGARTTVNNFSRIIAFEQILIGSNCAIASFVTILDHDHKYDFQDGSLQMEGYNTSPITIGSNVWIGDKCTVLKGVAIGDNVVIAANSLVNKDVPPNCIAGGIPVKIIKQLE